MVTMPKDKAKRSWERVDDMVMHETKKLARRKACQRINCTFLGEAAHERGWLHGLIDFVVKHDRMPSRDEQAELRRTADDIEAGLRELELLKPQPKVRGWGVLGGMGGTESLKAFRAIMKAKAYREVFGGEQEPIQPVPDPEAVAYADAMMAAPSRHQEHLPITE